MKGRRPGLALLTAVILATQAACAASTLPTTPAAPRDASITPTAPTNSIFVSPDGDDANPGTESAPVRSISQAAGMAQPGTQIVVADGTYEGSLKTEVSGTAEARIAFLAQNQGAARVVGDDSADIAWKNTGDHVDIVGFDISGPNVDGLTDGGSYVRIVDNRVHDFGTGNCITTANNDYDMHDIDVIGNVAFGCGEDELDHGIYVSHTRGVVANNVAYGNSGFGIHCWHNCNELTISNNLVFDNPEGGIVIGQGDGPNYGEVPADNFVVSNNIAVDNGRDGIRESGATGPNNEYLNNILWDNGTDRISLKTGTADGTIVGDPDFVNFQPDGSGDYRLQTGSPAVDAGVPTGAPVTAIDGTPRPQSKGVDIGIYER